MTTPTLPRTLPFSYGIESAISNLVPGKFPCALNGRPLMLDDGAQAGWSHEGIQQIRTQADSSTSPSESTLNPQGLWRRAQESWHRGAGQTYRDKPDADEFRFRSSKGVDVWTPYQMSLLPTTASAKSTSDTNLKLMTAGTRCYLGYGQKLAYTTDLINWTDVTSTPAATLTGLDSDGYTVYAGYGASGIYSTNTGTGAAASFVTGTVGVVAYVKGRLMCTGGASIYNVVTGGGAALPTALFTHGNSAFTWVGFAEGQAAIYAAGYAGDKSLIYRIAVKPDGSALDAPTVAGQLPDGEVITSISGYLGFILLGTQEGVRFCEADGQGNLTVGPLIDINRPVYAFEGQRKFVWFGYSDYDASSTGLGRMDLTQFTIDTITEGRQPSYASDLMAATSGAVQSIVTFTDLRVFAVSGQGVYAESINKVATATISSGVIGFGLPDAKTSIEIDVSTRPLAGSYTVSLAYDGATATSLSGQSTANTTLTQVPTSYTSAETFEVTLDLARDAVTTTGPTITRWTLKASPGANDGPAEFLMVPILLAESVKLPDGSTYYWDVADERDRIKALRESRQVILYQEATSSYQVQVENYQWQPTGLRYNTMSGSYRVPDATMLLQLKRLA